MLGHRELSQGISRRSIAALLCFALASTGADAAGFTPLGALGGGSRATGVSGDGAVVVGDAYESNHDNPKAFRWTDGVMTDLGHLPGGLAASASKVSADGSVVVGMSLANSVMVGTRTLYSRSSAFRWTGGVMTDLSYLLVPTINTTANNVSADGSVVVGSYGSNATRWSSAGDMIGLGDIGSAFPPRSSALGVSADGSVVVGQGNRVLDVNGFLSGQAFRWTSDEGMIGLGDLAGGTLHSTALSISANGLVVVGQGNRFDDGNGGYGGEAFRWTTDGGMVGLGDLAGGNGNSVAKDVSGDGSVVVGQGNRTSTGDGFYSGDAFIWTQETGMQPLFDVLVARGATGLSGWTLIEANGISADGKWVVGRGLNPLGVEEAFRANLSAVPIPATVFLLGTGILALGAQFRRRR